MPYRLYLVDRETGKCTGKKRDYPSEEHFKKWGIDTYHSYDTMNYQGAKAAKLCYLDENNKWAETTEEMKNNLGI